MTRLKMEKKRIFLVLAVLFLIQISIGFTTATDYSTCQGLSAIPSGNHRLISLVNNTGLGLPCFILTNSDVNFDCQGNYIWQDTNISYQGFELLNVSNITLRNCNIRGFQEAIFSYNSSSINIINSTFTALRNNGLNFTGVQNSLIEGNKFISDPDNSTSQYAIYIKGSQNNIILNNTIYEWANSGIYISNGTQNLISSNKINETTFSNVNAIFIESISTSIITGNVINYLPAPTQNYAIKIGEGSIFLNQSYIQISNNYFFPSTTDIFGILIDPLSDNIWMYEDSISNGNGSIELQGNKNNITATNCSYTSIRNNGNPLIDEFHARIIVKDANGSFVQNAQILWFNSTGQNAYSGLTDVNGIKNFNISDFYFNGTNKIGISPYFLNVSKDGIENTTFLFFSVGGNDDFKYTIFLNATLNETNATNQLPIITEPEANQYFGCVALNTPLIVYIKAIDPENDIIYYSYQCSLSDSIHPFTTNNTFICTYSNLGQYVIKMYANDTFHAEDYTSTNATIYVTDSGCIEGSGAFAVKIPTDLVNKNNINEGLLPTLYYSMINFVSTPFGAFLLLFYAIICILIILGIFSLIGLIFSGGRR